MSTLKQDLEADDVARQTTALLSILNYLAGQCMPCTVGPARLTQL